MPGSEISKGVPCCVATTPPASVRTMAAGARSQGASFVGEKVPKQSRGPPATEGGAARRSDLADVDADEGVLQLSRRDDVDGPAVERRAQAAGGAEHLVVDGGVDSADDRLRPPDAGGARRGAGGGGAAGVC